VHPIINRLTSAFTLLIMLFIVVACAPKPGPTPIVTATITLGPHPTLPPTWTPTATFTPAPSRIPTLTPSPIPTLSVEQICHDFSVIASPDPNIQIAQNAAALFGWKGIPDDVTMRLYIWQRGSRAGIFADVPISGDGLLPIPIQRLPEAYYFNWQIWLEHPTYGQICIHRGTFTRQLSMSF
jgi:hypothetical protein